MLFELSKSKLKREFESGLMNPLKNYMICDKTSSQNCNSAAQLRDFGGGAGFRGISGLSTRSRWPKTGGGVLGDPTYPRMLSESLSAPS